MNVTKEVFINKKYISDDSRISIIRRVEAVGNNPVVERVTISKANTAITFVTMLELNTLLDLITKCILDSENISEEISEEPNGNTL